MEHKDNKQNYYLYFEIINIQVIKTLFETLDKHIELLRFILYKGNINGNENRNKNMDMDINVNSDDRLEINCTNSTRTIYFNSKFGNELIKNLICDKKKIELEIIPNDLVNILKSYDSMDDYLSFYILKNDLNIANIEFKFHNLIENNLKVDTKTNSKKKKIDKKIIGENKEKKFSFKIGHPLYEERQIAKIDFEKMVSMNVDKFHKICKDINVVFDYLKIDLKNNKNLCFGYSTSKCEGIIKLKFDDKNILLKNLTNSKNNNISGTYKSADIAIFSKLSNITNEFNFKIKNNFIIETIYIIDKYGLINVMFIPIKDDLDKNLQKTHKLEYDNLSSASFNSTTNNDTITDKNVAGSKKTINDKIIYVELEKIDLFKSICECLEKIVSEPIIKLDTRDEFMKILIRCASNSKNINVQIEITNIFNRFKKLENIESIGINLKHLNDILKTTEKNDMIILSIDEKDKQNLCVEIKNINLDVKNNTNFNSKRIYKIKLLNIEENEILSDNHKDKTVYDILIDSNEFYKMCKDVNTIGEDLKITCDTKHFILSSNSECKYINIINNNGGLIEVKEINNDSNIEKKGMKKIINKFEIKDFMIFYKLSEFIDKINLRLGTDGVFIIGAKFVESMGKIKIRYMTKIMSEIEPDDINMIKSDVENMDDKLIFFKLKKINFFKNIFETLDKKISETEWFFKSDDASNNNLLCLEIVCTDSSKTLFVKTKLENELFKSFYCEKKIFKFQLENKYLVQILKLTEKNDVAIYCYIDKIDPTNLIIRFKNLIKKNKKIFKIPLSITNCDKKNLRQMTLDFEKKISLKPESLFSKCKCIGNVSQFIKISSDGKKLFFEPTNDKKGLLTLDKNEDDTLSIINLNDNSIVGCTYEINNILIFSKLVNDTKELSIFIKDKFALTLILNFENYGSMSVMLSPVSDEYINNNSYDYSDDDDDDIELLNNNSNILDL